MLEYKQWAVVGANSKPEKYGNKIFRRLRAKGYDVYPVNPVYKEIEGEQCYPDLSSLPSKPEVINMVVSPKRGGAFLKEAAELGIKYIWLQPGTHDDSVMSLIDELGLTALQGCVLVATR
ncbi:MAG: CoA-binding protein [Clostridiaceae bacterium]|nr:CoA-binding protein [Clostridiaceae bacterium]